MHHTAVHRRLPRAGIDPIDEAAAFAMVAASVHRPFRHETIVLLLDESRRGHSIVVVTDTVAPDSVVEIVECLAHGLHPDDLAAIVVATVRPAEADTGEVTAAVADADVDRWLEISHIASDAGVEVLEWWVIGATIRSPRDHLGEPPRW